MRRFDHDPRMYSTDADEAREYFEEKMTEAQRIIEESDAWRGPKQAKRKNTKKWCKGKVGREHVPVTVKNKSYGFLFDRGLVCGGKSFIRDKYTCYHHVLCSVCGKIIMDRPETCPDTGLATGW